MGKLILVTGGARSGKSSYAEKIAAEFGSEVLYIATSIPFDDEMKHRIKKHQMQRPAGWETLEAFKSLDSKLQGRLEGKSAVLLDCITIMVTNLMFDALEDWTDVTMEQIDEVEKSVTAEIDQLLTASRNSSVPFVLVTNETGMGIVPENLLSRVFRDISGRVNQRLARAADDVILCVSGIPVKIK